MKTCLTKQHTILARCSVDIERRLLLYLCNYKKKFLLSGLVL